LLLIDQERFFFYSDESEASHDEVEAGAGSAPARTGLRGWIHERYARFIAAWDHAESGALLWMRRAWNWLHSWAHPDEAMLARLWTARKIDLHHPAARPGDEVGAIWANYLAQQWRRHLVWFCCNALIAPFAFWLFILPGPNLIGYWFAYRTIHHLLILWGIRRARRNKTPTDLHALAALEVPIEHDDQGKACHAALAGTAARLDEHLAWHASARPLERAQRTSVTKAPQEPLPTHDVPEQPRDG
jgi:hypothetical protein